MNAGELGRRGDLSQRPLTNPGIRLDGLFCTVVVSWSLLKGHCSEVGSSSVILRKPMGGDIGGGLLFRLTSSEGLGTLRWRSAD